MKMPLIFLANYTFRTACVAGAVFLLWKGIDHGWGWLIFAAIVSGLSVNDDKCAKP